MIPWEALDASRDVWNDRGAFTCPYAHWFVIHTSRYMPRRLLVFCGGLN